MKFNSGRLYYNLLCRQCNIKSPQLNNYNLRQSMLTKRMSLEIVLCHNVIYSNVIIKYRLHIYIYIRYYFEINSMIQIINSYLIADINTNNLDR